jgi:hypothetical protein
VYSAAGIAFAIPLEMNTSRKIIWGSVLSLTFSLSASSVFAQSASAPAPQTAAATAPSQPATTADPDTRLDPLQPDFTLVALPDNLRLPEGRFAFRVTHRFLHSLGSGGVGDLLSNFFEFDTGAQIGLEVRYGLFKGTDIGVHRTSDRTMELFGQQSLLQQNDSHPLSLDAIVTLEGLNNLRGQKSSTLGVIASRKAGRIAALYVEPMFVVNTNPLAGATGMDKNTFMAGLGGRVHIRPAMYLVGEVTPRIAGYQPGANQISVGFEGRVGGHTFQVNFSNGYGTTLGQLARGGVDYHSWFIGFNISRKFF